MLKIDEPGGNEKWAQTGMGDQHYAVCIHPNNQTAPIDVLLQSFLVFDLSATVIIVYTHTIELIGLAESLENAQVREGHMTRYR